MCVCDARETERVSFDLVVWLRGWLICIYGYGGCIFLWGGKVKFVLEKQVLPRIYLLNCLVTEIKYIVVVVAGRQAAAALRAHF